MKGEKEVNITDFIPTGKANAVDIRQLEKMTEKTPREIGQMIRAARCAGAVILTKSHGGYWLPDYSDTDIQEQLQAFIRFMDSKNTFSATKTAKAALKKLQNAEQIQIGGV